MKLFTALNLTAAAIMALGISLGSAHDPAACRAKAAQSIQFWPHLGPASMMLSPPALNTAAQGEIVGTVAHVIAYVEDERSEGSVAIQPKQMFLYPTTGGGYAVRFLDLPDGHGWYGPF